MPGPCSLGYVEFEQWYCFSLDTGHISIYGTIQSLKHGSLQNEDFDTTTDHFNAV